ncbi:hypothetical protein HK099_005104 [Clydaea vesicula]|uniref:Core Histone H2A/H2B/H3 domain-containing protein n=1 Tax=Clydaea vesicula TaxID=447962 RepID=A0AAD5TZR8_9FUNG|nr:hypothetical protein HK099_005104 [Clydaea vesicula]
MISAEAPVMFAKACEIFIEELTLRAWMHAEENKRRTIQKSDIATAVSKSDMYDFLIDIVPREVDFIKSANGAVNKSNAAVAASNTAGSVISNSNSLITPQRSSSNKNMDDLYGNGDSFNNSYPYHSNYGPPQHESFNNYQSSTDLYSRYPSNAYSQQQHVVDAVGSGGGSAVNAVNGEHSKEALSEN